MTITEGIQTSHRVRQVINQAGDAALSSMLLEMCDGARDQQHQDRVKLRYLLDDIRFVFPEAHSVRFTRAPESGMHLDEVITEDGRSLITYSPSHQSLRIRVFNASAGFLNFRPISQDGLLVHDRLHGSYSVGIDGNPDW